MKKTFVDRGANQDKRDESSHPFTACNCTKNNDKNTRKKGC